MVVLNKIYTRTGDTGTTALGDGRRVAKSSARITAYGTVDETNATVGLVRLNTTEDALAGLDEMLARIQNDLFDLGADLCVPETNEPLAHEPLRITPGQVTRLETEMDALNENLAPLRSFVLPGGHPAAAGLHLSRTVARRAERLMAVLADMDGEPVSAPSLAYINRLSDFFFVASRWVNANAGGASGDVLWQPGQTR